MVNLVDAGRASRDADILNDGRRAPRPSLAQAVAGQLQELIGQRKLQAADRLPGERDLAEALKATRPVVREAIRLLEGLGIVSVEHGRGVFLVERQSLPLTDLSQLDSVFRLKLLRQATEVRQLIDTEAARAAARDASSEDLARIAQYLDDSEREPLLSQRKFSLALTFERLIGEATHNEYLVATQRLAHQMFESAWQSSGFIPRAASMRNDQHRSIFAALRTGDDRKAARLMTEHFSLAVFPDEDSPRAAAKTRPKRGT